MHEALMAGGSGTQREASAMLLSAVMMLDWLSDKHADSALADGARAIEIAMQRSFADGQVRSREFGGTSSTADIVRAVVAEL